MTGKDREKDEKKRIREEKRMRGEILRREICKNESKE